MANFNKGDKIKFIDDIGEGVVINVLPDGLLLIEDDNGFDYEIDQNKVMKATDGREEEKAYKRHTPSFEQIVNSDVDQEKLKKANEAFDRKYLKKKVTSTPEDVMEVDLHIHELIDTDQGLDSHEKLQIQIEHFERMMKRAEEQRKHRVIFIHGIGQGVLRHKIRTMLDDYYPNAEYLDGSYATYGQGATEIRLRR